MCSHLAAKHNDFVVADLNESLDNGAADVARPSCYSNDNHGGQWDLRRKAASLDDCCVGF